MIKKIKEKLFEYKYVILIYALLFILIIPILNLFRYSIMNADDFIYGQNTHHVWEDTHSLVNVLKEAFKNTVLYYKIWQGSFVSVFLMYMQPGIFSVTAYRIALLLLFLLGLISPLVCILTINKYLLKTSKKIILIIYAVITIIMLQYLPSPYEAWYWYNGVVYYQFVFNIILLFITSTIIMMNKRKKATQVFSIILLAIFILIIGGSNYITSITFLIGYSIFIIDALHKKKELRWIHLALWILFIVVFSSNVFAPGNSARASLTIQPTLPLITIFSIRDFTLETTQWIGMTLTVAAILISAFFAKDIVKNSKIKFVHPIILLIVVVMILVSQYAPTIYGLGHKGPPRCENIRFMTFQISLWLMAINLFGWLYQKEKLERLKIIPTVVISLFLISYSIVQYPLTQMWSYKALDYYIGGSIEKFGKEMNYRIEKFEDKKNNEPLAFDVAVTNEMLHPTEEEWWWFGIWDFYRKEPKR